MKYSLIVIGILMVVSVILFLIILLKNKSIKQMKETTKTLINANNNLHEEIIKFNDADKIKSENRSEANEKINELHNGDSVSNAINVLRNNKS